MTTSSSTRTCRKQYGSHRRYEYRYGHHRHSAGPALPSPGLRQSSASSSSGWAPAYYYQRAIARRRPVRPVHCSHPPPPTRRRRRHRPLLTYSLQLGTSPRRPPRQPRPAGGGAGGVGAPRPALLVRPTGRRPRCRPARADTPLRRALLPPSLSLHAFYSRAGSAHACAGLPSALSGEMGRVWRRVTHSAVVPNVSCVFSLFYLFISKFLLVLRCGVLRNATTSAPGLWVDRFRGAHTVASRRHQQKQEDTGGP